MALNRATVIGYLGQDPQLRYTEAVAISMRQS